MEFISFNAELALATILFARVFSNIQIERTNSKGEKYWHKVHCVNAQRSRVLKNLENPERKAGFKLPLIAYTRTGYSRNGERLNNLNNEVKYEITSKWRDQNLLTPVPVDISFDLTVYAKYQADIDKIASNFMVFFNNDIYVTQDHPKFHGVRLNNQIQMSDNVSEDHPDEFDGSQDDVITATFNFTFKTYLFAGTQKYRKVQNQVSSYLSTVLSSYVYEFKSDDDVRNYLSSENHNRLSTILQEEMTVEVSTYTETSSDQYDDGIPKIKSLNFGFYAVPQKEDFDQYMLSVDGEMLAKHELIGVSGYISSESYLPKYEITKDDEGNTICVLTALSSVNDCYDEVDNMCTLAPYVDRLKWTVDENSKHPFPYNVLPEFVC